MNRFATVVANGTVILPDGTAKVDIGISDGCIAALAEPGMLRGEDVIDARAQLVLPGVLDIHVHFRQPGGEAKEDFWHGTMAAACGGVTAICDMPNTKPSVTSAAVLEHKIAAVGANAWVDYGLWAGGCIVENFAAMAAAGAVGLKVYMNRPRNASDPYASDLSVFDDAQLVAVLRESGRIGWPVCVHVASPALDFAALDCFKAAGRRDAHATVEFLRTPESLEAFHRLIHLADVAGARLHIAHVSLNHIGGLDIVAAAKRAGQRVTTEVAPPFLDDGDLDRLGPLAVPFAYPAVELARYQSGLVSGLIDLVATDHAPHRREEKECGDAWAAPTGYPGVETLLPLMLDFALGGGMSLKRLADVTAGAPATLVGLSHKGAIAVGRDADLVFADPTAEHVVDEALLHSKAGFSPYHGRRLRGRICRTMLRGEIISENGEIVATAPSGRMLTRPQPAEADPPREMA